MATRRRSPSARESRPTEPAGTRLSFHASRVQHESGAGEVASLSFEVEADGDPTIYFSMMLEEPEQSEVRVSWGDGTDARDECVVALASASLAPGRFTAELGEPRPECVGPYRGVEITFDALDDEDARAAAAALSALVPGLGGAKPVATPGKAAPAPSTTRAREPAIPLRRGPPTLGLAATARSAWRAPVSSSLEIVLAMSNLGGPLEGVAIELAGPALDSGLVVPDRVSIAGSDVPFDVGGGPATARLPSARLSASIDGERNRNSPPPPSIPVRIVLSGARPGSALLTVRAHPLAAEGRAGSAMCGRTVVIDP